MRHVRIYGNAKKTLVPAGTHSFSFMGIIDEVGSYGSPSVTGRQIMMGRLVQRIDHDDGAGVGPRTTATTTLISSVLPPTN